MKRRKSGTCFDCGRPYGEPGFPDLIIPTYIWREISPTGNEGGLLCPSCICARLEKAGKKDIPGSFMSGPIKSVDPDLMDILRRVENLEPSGRE